MNVDNHLASKGFRYVYHASYVLLVADGVPRIYAHPCFNLDLDGGKPENNTRVAVWGQWTEEQGTAPHQSWRFIEA